MSPAASSVWILLPCCPWTYTTSRPCPSVPIHLKYTLNGCLRYLNRKTSSGLVLPLTCSRRWTRAMYESSVAYRSAAMRYSARSRAVGFSGSDTGEGAAVALAVGTGREVISVAVVAVAGRMAAVVGFSVGTREGWAAIGARGSGRVTMGWGISVGRADDRGG